MQLSFRWQPPSNGRYLHVNFQEINRYLDDKKQTNMFLNSWCRCVREKIAAVQSEKCIYRASDAGRDRPTLSVSYF